MSVGVSLAAKIPVGKDPGNLQVHSCSTLIVDRHIGFNMSPIKLKMVKN